MHRTWEQIELHSETGSVELTVTDALIDDHLRQSGIHEGAYQTAGAPRMCPPDLLSSLTVRPLFQTFIQREIGPNVRVRQIFRFLQPVHAGETVKSVGRIVSKHEARGQQFFTIEAVFTNASGEPVVIDRRTQMLLKPKAAT